MSILAKLLIDNVEVDVRRFQFEFHQEADINGRPNKKTTFNGLKLEIESRRDLNLADWSFAKDQKKKIELHIYPRTLDTKTRKLYFYDSHLLYWKTHFSATGEQPMTETLHISSGYVKDNNSDGKYLASWGKNYTHNTTTTTRNEDKEKKITNYYLTNTNNEPIDDYKKNDIIVVNIETLNRIGDSITINLNDVQYDFEYNESLLVNDTLENITINSDLEQIQLKVVEQKSQN